MSITHLPTPIYNALENKRLNEFTVVECLKAGYGEENTSYSNAAGYGFVYLQLMKLVNKGLLSRKSDGRNLIFAKTGKYYNESINNCILRADEMSPSVNNPLHYLNERYSFYENQIKILSGEKDECDELANMYPQFEYVINNISSQADEKINIILGRIKSVKAVIDVVSSHQETK
ncbi:hypothetical protein [Aeromonas salmonicida]|uniref:hypothetical protein n=1 Tax=Aeromonas salmonicida TaxID=645 RepID=UPI003D19A1D1